MHCLLHHVLRDCHFIGMRFRNSSRNGGHDLRPLRALRDDHDAVAERVPSIPFHFLVRLPSEPLKIVWIVIFQMNDQKKNSATQYHGRSQ